MFAVMFRAIHSRIQFRIIHLPGVLLITVWGIVLLSLSRQVAELVDGLGLRMGARCVVFW